MDLLSVLPDFPTKPYTHILPPLERANLNTVDLITLDCLEIAKRAHVPPADVRRLSSHVVKALHHDVGFEEPTGPEPAEPSSSINFDAPLTPGPCNRFDLSQWNVISTLDPVLDALLAGGGIPTGYVTEVTGERCVFLDLMNGSEQGVSSPSSTVQAAKLNSSLPSSCRSSSLLPVA